MVIFLQLFNSQQYFSLLKASKCIGTITNDYISRSEIKCIPQLLRDKDDHE